MQLIFDTIFADSMEFSVSRTALSMGQGRSTMDEVYRALAAEVGLELIDYASAQRIPVGDRVELKFRGAKWLRGETSE